ENSIPAGEPGQTAPPSMLVGQSIIAQAIAIASPHAIVQPSNLGPPRGYNRKIDQKRLSDNVLSGHKPPVTAVHAVVPVVAQDKIFSPRNNQLAVLHILPHLSPPSRAYAGIGIRRSRKFISKYAGKTADIHRERFVLRSPIDENPAVVEMDAIAGNSDNAFYQMEGMIDRIVKHHNVVPPNRLIRQQVPPSSGRREHSFVHQQKVSNQQGIFHRPGRNA